VTERERRNRDHLVWFIEEMTYYEYPGRLADIRRVTGDDRRDEARALLQPLVDDAAETDAHVTGMGDAVGEVYPPRVRRDVVAELLRRHWRAQ
jgi:hypothetical protein